MTNTPTKIVYTAKATVTGGRAGHAKSEDGILDQDKQPHLPTWIAMSSG